MENDMLSSLLSDPEALQNAMKTVSDLLGGQPSAQTEPQNAYDPASEMMQKALPVIGAIAQSGQNAVKPEKRALLGALKPLDRKSTRLNSSHLEQSRMPSSA